MSGRTGKNFRGFRRGPPVTMIFPFPGEPMITILFWQRLIAGQGFEEDREVVL